MMVNTLLLAMQNDSNLITPMPPFTMMQQYGAHIIHKSNHVQHLLYLLYPATLKWLGHIWLWV
jgi:hypothetical protein